ncbi:hypothetical protein [Lysinibacillus endophyticus]|uniref:hypothetical protein n=1 Tax=Ureibacillus endophyticus TaxID=1978490 RepID=UPI003134F43E
MIRQVVLTAEEYEETEKLELEFYEMKKQFNVQNNKIEFEKLKKIVSKMFLDEKR